MSEVKKDMYLVLKLEDIYKYLDDKEFEIFYSLVGKVNECRIRDEKKNNSYYVCNRDEPYAEKVLSEILKGEDCKGELL